MEMKDLLEVRRMVDSNIPRVMGHPPSDPSTAAYFEYLRRRGKLQRELAPTTPEWIIETMVKLSYVRDGWEI